MDKFDPGKKRSDEEHHYQYHIKLNRLSDVVLTAAIGLTFTTLFYGIADYNEIFHGLSEIVAIIGKFVVPGMFALATGQKLFLWYQTPSDEEEIRTVKTGNLKGADQALFDDSGPPRPRLTRDQATPSFLPRLDERRIDPSLEDDLVSYAQQELRQPGAGERLRQKRRQEFDQAWGIQSKPHASDNA